MGQVSDASRWAGLLSLGLLALLVAGLVAGEVVDPLAVGVFLVGALAVLGLAWRYREEY